MRGRGNLRPAISFKQTVGLFLPWPVELGDSALLIFAYSLMEDFERRPR